MHPKLLSFSLLIFLLSAFNRGMAQTSEDSTLIRHLAETILTDGKTYNDLKFLTKGVGARLSGSAGYYKAEIWGQKALEDAKAEKVWLQECMVPHWVRGGRDSATFNWGGTYSNKNIRGRLTSWPWAIPWERGRRASRRL